ncbi:unnamed protein product, partial [Soboliphyme baturini]|uniref:tRNA (guanine(37)-N1)-methyltransferase n=1 Tax=Soboliphyme baturini TaxID=241478 RepID=A0A183IWL3_9BILA
KVFVDPTAFVEEKVKISELSAKLGDAVPFEIRHEELKLGYENWQIDDVLKAVLPDGLSLSAHTIVGHIAHVNLKAELLPFRFLIGQVLIDKIKQCLTVVNKTDCVKSPFRNLQFEVLAGEKKYLTRVKENGVAYDLDFSRVFWNSRLGTEHDRLVHLFDRDDAVFDVFAGVGPFAIPARKRGCTVIANDLNPDCVKWLRHNCEINKVHVEVHESEADEFLTKQVPVYLKKMLCEGEDHPHPTAIHFIMNLPAAAVTFLPLFVGLLSDVSDDYMKRKPKFFIHCYTFTNADDFQADGKEQVTKALNGWTLEGLSVFRVRDVSTRKIMLRVTFLASWRMLKGSKRRDI